MSGAIDAMVSAIAALKDSKSRLSGDTLLNLAQLARRLLSTAVRTGSKHTVAADTLSRLERPMTEVAADYEFQSNNIIAHFRVRWLTSSRTGRIVTRRNSKKMRRSKWTS